MKYQVTDDSDKGNNGKVLFESNDRAEANEFYKAYEKHPDHVANLQRNPNHKK